MSSLERKAVMGLEADRIREIEARWKAGTPGPWRVGKESIWTGNVYGPSAAELPPADAEIAGIIIASIGEFYPNAKTNAAKIAHAPTDIAYLLEVVREMGRKP